MRAMARMRYTGEFQAQAVEAARPTILTDPFRHSGNQSPMCPVRNPFLGSLVTLATKARRPEAAFCITRLDIGN